MNLKEIETLRTKEELVNYFEEMGQRITEEEIEALKKSYEQAKGKDGSLTLEQLEYVAGGGVPIREIEPGRFHGDFLTRVGFVLLSHILLHPEIAKAHMQQASVAALDPKHQRYAVPEHPAASTAAVSTTEVDLHASVESQPLTTQVAGAQAQDYGRPTVDTLLEIEKGQEHFTFNNHGQEVTIPNSLVRALIAPEILHVGHESQRHIVVNNPDVRNVLLMHKAKLEKDAAASKELADVNCMLYGKIHQIERGRLFNIVDKILGKEGLSEFINRQVTEQQHLLTDGFHLFKESKPNITQSALSVLNRFNRGDKLDETDINVFLHGICSSNDIGIKTDIIINPEGKYCAFGYEYNHAEVTAANYGCKVLHLSGRVDKFEGSAAVPSTPADRTEAEKALRLGPEDIELSEPEYQLAQYMGVGTYEEAVERNPKHDEHQVDAGTVKDLFYVMNERNEKILIADGTHSIAITDEACNIIARDMSNYPFGATKKWNGLVECTREENLGGKIVLSFINRNGIREYRTQNGLLFLERDSKGNVISMYDSFFEMIGNELSKRLSIITTRFGLEFHYEDKLNDKIIFSFINPKGQKEVRCSDGSLLFRSIPEDGRVSCITKSFFKVYEKQLERLRPGDTLFGVFKYEFGAELTDGPFWNTLAKSEFGTVFSYIDQNGETQYRNQRGEKFYKFPIFTYKVKEYIVKLKQRYIDDGGLELIYASFDSVDRIWSSYVVYFENEDGTNCFMLGFSLFDTITAQLKDAPVGATAKLFPESKVLFTKIDEYCFSCTGDNRIRALDYGDIIFEVKDHKSFDIYSRDDSRVETRFKQIIWSKVKDLNDGETIDCFDVPVTKTSHNSFQCNISGDGLTTFTVEDVD